MTHTEVELLAIGAGPANLALAVAMEELAPGRLADETVIVEQHDDIVWQRGMLIPWAQSQVSFLKDLVTLRNPTSPFSFVNYLHEAGRLDEFINLGSFTPYRLEISGYLRWVARSLERVRVQYGRRCTGITPQIGPDGAVHRWSVELSDGDRIETSNLVIGAGRDPHVPAEFRSLPAERLVHSTDFVTRAPQIEAAGPARFAVIGGAQSAAEMAWSLYQGFPQAQCTMVMRSIGLNCYESSKFTNELFYPSFVDTFHDAEPGARGQLLSEMHRTNYSGLAPGLLDSLYRQIYQDRLTGAERFSMITMVDVESARMDGEDVVLSLVDRHHARRTELRCDMVMLGTGFVRQMPRAVCDLARACGVPQITVNRNYRLGLPAGSTAGCYLQGVNESTHGIADSLLSVLAARSEEIIGDLLARRRDGVPHPVPVLSRIA